MMPGLDAIEGIQMTTTENADNTAAETTSSAAPAEPNPAAAAKVDGAAPATAAPGRAPRVGTSPRSPDRDRDRDSDGDDDRGDRNRRGGGRGVRVEGNLEKAIRQFRKRIERQGLFRELRKRRFFEKPSERRKRKHREAEKRLRKKSRSD